MTEKDRQCDGLMIQLPVKFDTPLYFLWSRQQAINYDQHTSGIYETTNWRYSLSKNGIYITTTGRSVSYCGQFLYKLGESVFLTKEKAEAKLKELEGNNGCRLSQSRRSAQGNCERDFGENKDGI